MTPTWKSELPSWLFIAVMFALLAFSWSWSPAKIPVHWNLQGDVDRYGSRFEGLVIIPLVSVLLYVFFRFLPSIDPRRGNYAAFQTAYNVIRHGALAFMAIIYALTIAILRGAPVDMALAVSTLTAVFFILVGALMPTLRPNWFFGFRTPWALSSEVAWVRAQRVAGWTMIVTGVGMAIAGWLRTPAFIAAVVAVLLVGMGVAAWVSYAAWRDDPDRAG